VHILGAPPSLASPPIVPEMAGSSSDSDAGEQLLHDDGGHSGAVTCLPGVCFSCVSSGNVGVVQRFGRYIGYQEPGCIPYCPCLDTITTVSMKTKQLACNTDCKTHDNVTLRVSTSITYRVNKKMLKAAVFDIDNPEYQMQAYVDNVVRSLLPTMDLDDAYSNKDTLCHQILAELQRSMAPYGHHILNALVTDLSPDPAVLQAMNAINAAKRHRMAASEQAEAQKALQVKAAEADAESKYLAGTGEGHGRGCQGVHAADDRCWPLAPRRHALDGHHSVHRYAERLCGKPKLLSHHGAEWPRCGQGRGGAGPRRLHHRKCSGASQSARHALGFPGRPVESEE